MSVLYRTPSRTWRFLPFASCMADQPGGGCENLSLRTFLHRLSKRQCGHRVTQLIEVYYPSLATSPWGMELRPVLIIWTEDFHGERDVFIRNYTTGVTLSTTGLQWDCSAHGYPTEWSLSGNGRFAAFADLTDVERNVHSTA